MSSKDICDSTKEIVIAMINNGYITKSTSNNDSNIENVNKALQQVFNKLNSLEEDFVKTRN